MRVVNGKEVLETLDELVDPKHAALVIIDVQNDYVSKGGLLDRLGYDVSMMAPMVEVVRKLIGEARAHDVPIVYVQDTRLPDSKSESGPFLRFITVKCGLPPDVTLQGSWGWEFAPEIAPEPGDIVVPKFREGAFVGTALDLMLRSNGIQTVVMVGDVTQGCLESSARDALLHNYYVVVVRDGVASHLHELHEASIKVMESKFDVVDSDEVTALWRDAAPAPQKRALVDAESS
jgi:nicotinamidase-related amidase